MSDYSDSSSESSDDEEEATNRLGKLVSADEYRAFVNEVTLENDFLEIAADGQTLDLVTLGLSSTCLVIGKDNCDIYSGDASRRPDQTGPRGPYVGTFELKRILFLEQVRLTVHEPWRSRLKLELPNGRSYVYQLHAEIAPFLVWKTWQGRVCTLETDYPRYRAEYLRIKRQVRRERREDTWQSSCWLFGSGEGGGGHTPDTDEDEHYAGTKRTTSDDLHAEIYHPNVRSESTSEPDVDQNGFSFGINAPVRCSTPSSFTNVTPRSGGWDSLDKSDNDVEFWSQPASSNDSDREISLGRSDQDLGCLPPKYLTLYVHSLFGKTNVEFHRHGETRLCRAASLVRLSERDGDETWSDLAGTTRSSLLRYSSLPDILEGQAGFLWERSRVVEREMTVDGHHVEMTPEEVSLLREVMTLRKTPADLDIYVITDFTSDQDGHVVRVTRSVGNLGRHLENVEFLNTPSSGTVEKCQPEIQIREDPSIDDVFQEYIVLHPEMSPTKRKTGRRKSLAAAFNSILHSPKSQSHSPKGKGHSRQDRSSKEHSGKKKHSFLNTSSMTTNKTRRKSVAQVLAKPFVKLKKSGSKLLAKRNASVSAVSEDVSTLAVPTLFLENDGDISNLSNHTQTSVKEERVLKRLGEEDEVKNFGLDRLVSNVSFNRCHLSTSPSRISHAQLERRDRTYTRAWQIQPTEIARELTLIERDLLVRILDAELVDCVWTGHDKEKRAPNITKMMAFFERLVHLVTSEVMHEETPESRANVIAGFINVADQCRLMRNFDSLCAVLAGLQLLPVFRLEQTWEVLRTQHREQYRLFVELCDLVSEESNYRVYHKALKHALKESACVPLMGVFLQTTAAINSIKHVDPGQVTRRELRSVRREHQAKERGGEAHKDRDPEELLENMTEADKELIIRLIRRWKEQRALRLQREAERKVRIDRRTSEMLTEEPKGWWQRRIFNFRKRKSKKNINERSAHGVYVEHVETEEYRGGEIHGQGGHSFLKWGKLMQDLPTQHKTWAPSFRSWGKSHQEDQSIPTTGVSSHHHILDSDKNLDHELESAHRLDIQGDDMEVSRYTSANQRRMLAVAFGSADSDDEDIPANLAHKPFEMLQQYQMSAVQYRDASDPSVRDFLLRATYNTECDNYRLSHEKEPSQTTWS